MAFNLPSLKRTSAPQAAPNEPLKVPQIDVTSGMERVGKQIDSTASEVIHAMERAEDSAADVVATTKMNQFESEFKEALNGKNGVRYVKGDPVEAYNKFDAQMKARYEELSSPDSGMSEKARKKFQAKFADRYSNLYDLRTTAYGSQFDAYRRDVRDNEVKLGKDAGLDATTFMRSNDPTSTKAFDSAIARVRDAHVRYAEERGGVEIIPGKDGMPDRYKLSPGVDVELRKDLSEMTYNAIDNLIAANQVDLAKTMQEKYGDYIDPVRMEKVTKSLREADIKVQAFDAVSKAEGRTFEEQKATIDKIKDSEVKQKALEYLDSRERYVENLDKRSSKDTFDRLANLIHERERSDQPFLDTVELEEDPRFKRMIGRVTDSKQREALYQMVKQPKESNPEAMNNALNAIAEGRLTGMSTAGLTELSANLSKDDRRWLRDRWTKDNTETESQERSRSQYILNRLRSRAEGLGLWKRDRFGNLSKQDLELKTRFEQEVTTQFDRFPKGSGVDAMNTWLEDYLTKKVAQKNKQNTSWFSGWFGSGNKEVKPLEEIQQGPARRNGTRANQPAAPSGSVPPAQAPPGGVAINKMSDQDRLGWLTRFKQENQGRSPKDLNELKTFIESSQKK